MTDSELERVRREVALRLPPVYPAGRHPYAYRVTAGTWTVEVLVANIVHENEQCLLVVGHDGRLQRWPASAPWLFRCPVFAWEVHDQIKKREVRPA